MLADLLQHYSEIMSAADDSTFAVLSFCYAALYLEHPDHVKSNTGRPPSYEGLMHRVRRFRGSSAYEPLISSDEAFQYTVQGTNVPLRKYALAYQGLARCIPTLHAAQPHFRIPKSMDIPFAQLMRSLHPFPSTSKPMALDLCHLDGSSLRQFLGDGEWIGFYGYGSSFQRVDPPMRDISFQLRPSVRGDQQSFRVLSDGRDGVGYFKLDGHAYHGSGIISIVKQYNGGHTWKWSAFVTPLGIVGTWDDGVHQSFGGWVWLWKKSWTEG